MINSELEKNIKKTIKENDIKAFKSLIKKYNINKSNINNNYITSLISFSSTKGYFEISKTLNNMFGNYLINNNYILFSINNNHTNLFIELIKNKKDIANYDNNILINTAFKNKNTEIINTLFLFKSVRNTLLKDNPYLYKKLIKKEIFYKLINF